MFCNTKSAWNPISNMILVRNLVEVMDYRIYDIPAIWENGMRATGKMIDGVLFPEYHWPRWSRGAKLPESVFDVSFISASKSWDACGHRNEFLKIRPSAFTLNRVYFEPRLPVTLKISWRVEKFVSDSVCVACKYIKISDGIKWKST